jgi:DNA polymerase III alpha subunit
VLESLIKSGALDRFGERTQLLHNIELLLAFAQRPKNKQAVVKLIFLEIK